MPLVSVIVTTYNRENLLLETIEGVLSQTFRDFELIIVDNCSNYDFMGMMKQLGDERIRAFQNQNDGIIARNRNVGVQQATGKYLAFCDDDDVWLPEKLEKQVKSLESGRYDLVYTSANLLFESGKIKSSTYKKISSLKQLLMSNQITLSSVLVKNSKEVVFNEDPNFVAVEDYELWIRLMLTGFRFDFIEIPLLNYRVVLSSVSNSRKAKNELVNMRFRYGLLKRNNLKFSDKVIVFFQWLRRALRFQVFRILRK